jgi:hypothetical protein
LRNCNANCFTTLNPGGIRKAKTGTSNGKNNAEIISVFLP